MNELINSVKTEEVADLPLKLNLQFFAEEPTDEPVDEPVDDESIDETPDDTTDEPIDDDQGVKGEEPADPQQQNFKDDPQNAAFAQMRREKEAYEQQIQAMNDMISQQYGDMGIYTFEQYQQALQEQQQEAERQQFAQAGLAPELADKLAKVDQYLEQAEQEKYDRFLLDGFNELQGEYSDLVKTPEDIPPETWQKWQDGKTGLTLLEAYELTNKQAIRDHLQASAKQSTLNNINSKEHLKGNGGEGSDDIDITSVPADVMQAYHQLFAKELRTGKMTDADFVKDYKKHTKG